MKKYFFLAFVAIVTFATSCTSENDTMQTSQNQTIDYSFFQKSNDTLVIDTGGQGGSTPIKP